MIQDESELREIVTRTLESQGVLNQIRADIRAAVYQAIAEQEKSETIGNKQKKRNQVFDTPDGVLAYELIYEFLEFVEWKRTISVLKPESQLNENPNPSREHMLRSISFESNDTKQPLLLQLISELRKLQKNLADAASPKRSPPKSAASRNEDKNSRAKSSPTKPSERSPIKPSRSSPAKPSPTKPRQDSSEKSPNNRSPNRKSSSPAKLNAELSSLNAKIGQMEKEDSSLKELKATLQHELTNPTQCGEDDDEEEYGSEYGSDFEEEVEEEEIIEEESDSFADEENEEDDAEREQDPLGGYDYIEPAERP